MEDEMYVKNTNERLKKEGIPYRFRTKKQAKDIKNGKLR